MPRPKAHIFPRTTGLTATGSCGHTYTDRVTLGREYTGKERTPERVEAVEAYLTRVISERAGHDCPTCRAEMDKTAAAGWVHDALTVFNLPPLPELTGTPRQVAVAQWLRYQRLVSLRWSAQRHAMQLLRANVMTVLLMSALTKAHEIPQSDVAVTSDIRALGYLADSGYNQNQPLPQTPLTELYPAIPLGATIAARETENITYGLANWLLLRYLVDVTKLHDSAASAETWVKAYFANRNRPIFLRADMLNPVIDIPLDVVVTAVAVASQHSWKDRTQAEEAFKAGCQEAGRTMQPFLHNLSGTPLDETMEQAAVFAALQPGNDWADSQIPF